MTKTTLPIDLALKTVTTKVSVGAWERAQSLKEKHGVRLSDIISACLLHMPEAQLVSILKTQKEKVDSLPKSVRGMLTNIDKLSEAEKVMLREVLS